MTVSTVLKPTTPKEVFAAKAQRLQLMWLAFPPNREFALDDDALLRRFCTDERMHEVWELLVQFDDDDFRVFIDEVLMSVGGMRELLEMPASFREWRCEIAEARMRTELFIEMCETFPVFRLPLSHVPPETIRKYFPDLLVQAKEAYLALMAEEANAEENEQEEVGDLSRKFSDGRAELACDFCHTMKRHTGQPHYEAVAALLKTILDIDEITADAVRKMCTRAVQRDRTIRPPK
jgi:hypothetical protein